MVYTTSDIHQLGSIMGIWAHPDDETWSSAGLMAAARDNNQPVFVLSATSGDAGQTADEARWASTDLKTIRRLELQSALRAINVTDFEVLDYQDGSLADADDTKVIAQISQAIANFKPDTIITFEPCGITGHQDHRTISKWALAAAKQQKKDIRVLGAVDTEESYNSVGRHAHELFNVYFAIDKPVLYPEDDVAVCYHLSPADAKKKWAAFEAHASQTHALFEHEIGQKLLNQSIQKECFIDLT